MATASPPERSLTARRAFRPRFSLAAALIAMTLCAVGLWYWYRVPFEVEVVIHQGRPGTWGTDPQGNRYWVARETDIRKLKTVRRVWSGTVPHGFCRTFYDGLLVRQEAYHDGIPHGPWEWRTDAGKLYLAATYAKGQPVEVKPSAGCDAGLAKIMLERTADYQSLSFALQEPTVMQFNDTRFEAAMRKLADQHAIPILYDTRGIDLQKLDQRVDVRAVGVPLILGLSTLREQVGLACEYRHGVLWITKPELVGQDRTGVGKLIPPPDSQLAEMWIKPIRRCEYSRTPPERVFSVLSNQTQRRVRFDLSRLPTAFVQGQDPESLVTLSLERLSFKHVLAILLDRLGCQARLDGETIVVELQPPDPSGAP